MKLNICSIVVTCFILSSVMLYSPLAHSQEPPTTPVMQSKALENIKFRKILSTGVAFNGSIIQDRDGFFWIATQAGLYKYNGSDIKKYDTTNSPMKGARIQTVFEDSDGKIWITTQGTGVYRYDKNTDAFAVYLADEENVNSISGNDFNWSPYAIEEDNEGFVWIGSTSGLNRYDKTTDTFTRYKNTSGEAGTLSNDDVWAVVKDNAGVVWVGTSDGLNRYDKHTETFTTYKDKDYKANTIYALYEDSRGTLWLGTDNIGLASFDKTAGKLISHSQTDKAFKVVSSISEYGDSLLLSHGIGDDGLSSFNRKTRAFNTYTTKSKSFGLEDNSTMHTLVDKLGRLWVVTFSAIHIYDPLASQFEYFSVPSNNPEHRIKNVLNMIEDKNGDIWMGTFGYGVFRYKPETDAITQYLSDKDDPDSLPNNDTPSLLTDSNGDLLVGGEGFLATLDPETGKVEKTLETPRFELLHLLEDKQNPDIIWGSLFKHGLLRINKQTGEYNLYANDPSDSGSLGSNFFLHMHQEDDGTLWIATSGGGLQEFDREREIFTSYKNNPENPLTIGNDTVNGITVSSDGRTWWLTSEAGGGLIKFDRKNELFENLNTQKGFPTDNTAHIIEDDDGDLWIATSDIGILRYTPNTRKYKKYGEDKGIMPGQFWASSGLKASDGAIYFGGLNGFNKFYPDRIRHDTLVPPVYFTSLTQGGKPIELNSAVELTQHIQLDWRNNFFEFEYAALNYPSSQSNEYMYRLEGWDPPDLWYKAGPLRSGRYSGLKSGTYTLHVKGTNNDGVWNKQGARIRVSVAPPFWDTIWAYIIYAAACIFIIGMILAYKKRELARQQLKNIELEEKVNMRTAELRNAYEEVDEKVRQRTAALKKSEEKYQTLVERMNEGLMVLDSNAKITFVNRTMGELLGYGLDNLLGRQVYDFFDAENRKLLSEQLKLRKAGKVSSYEIIWRKIDNTMLHTIISPQILRDEEGQYIGSFAVITDITEKRYVEEQLRHAQKMEAIGTLAGGIAHDFNNILAAIFGNAEMAKDELPSGSKQKLYIEQVLTAGMKAKELVKQILAFSRQEKVEKFHLQPAPIINEALKLLRSTIPATITIHQSIEKKCGLILADPTQVHQILMNLSTNAFHAMEKTGGTLSITLEKTKFAKGELPHEPELNPGIYIKLTVQDTGPGIPPDVKDKLFDPYFTTKVAGKGTGLGLSIVHGIVKDSGGSIFVNSELGKGTAFHVFLPVIQEEEPQEIETYNRLPVGNERILFLDDEKVLTIIGKATLEKLGYSVTVFSSSIEAFKAFQNQPNQFDLVITDQTMPDMTGIELSKRLIDIRPDIPIILCTGHSSIISADDAKSLGVKEFAFKPLLKKDIAVLIRKVLDET